MTPKLISLKRKRRIWVYKLYIYWKEIKVSIKKHLDLLGHEVRDKVSDFKGVVISISFDLYGCIQADVRSKDIDSKGSIPMGCWLDVSRLVVLSKHSLMDAPNFESRNAAEGKIGPANLPLKM